MTSSYFDTVGIIDENFIRIKNISLAIGQSLETATILGKKLYIERMIFMGADSSIVQTLLAFCTLQIWLQVGESLISVTVRFEQPEYSFSEDIGTAEVCLIKDLETVSGVTVPVNINTADGSAFGMHVHEFK